MKSDNKAYQKKVILQVVPSLHSGGVERGTLEIAKKIVEMGHKSIVVSAGGPLVEDLTAAGSLHVTMNVASKNPWVIWRNGSRIEQLVKEHQVDIIHARSRAPAWSCLLAARSSQAKLITTFHGIYNFSNIFKKYYNSIMTQGDKVIAVSNFVKEHIVNNYQTDPDKVTVIHRGVDLQYFNPELITAEIVEKVKNKYNVPKDTPIILLPSRFTRWKGQHVLVKAIAQLKELNFYCIMAGDLAKHPNYVKAVKEQICEYQIQNKVQIFGNEADMLALYGAADIILSTSIEPEAFGRTIIEAQAMQKLVIATNLGGAAETIQHGKNGMHVVPDNARELANQIQKALFLFGSAEHQKMAIQARQTVEEQFSLESMLNKVLEVYQQI